MGANDWHVNKQGKLVNGLATPDELLGLTSEIDDAVVANELAMRALDQLNKLHARERPMLTGKGAIVVNPKDKYIQSDEYANIDDARAAASDIAYRDGVAIIYVPVETLRPDRPVVASRPSELLASMGLASPPPPAAIGSGTPVASSTTAAPKV